MASCLDQVASHKPRFFQPLHYSVSLASRVRWLSLLVACLVDLEYQNRWTAPLKAPLGKPHLF